MTKEETLSELYGLRAGLSVISQNYDEIQSHERTISSIQQNLSNTRDDISAKKDSLQNKKNELLRKKNTDYSQTEDGKLLLERIKESTIRYKLFTLFNKLSDFLKFVFDIISTFFKDALKDFKDNRKAILTFLLLGGWILVLIAAWLAVAAAVLVIGLCLAIPLGIIFTIIYILISCFTPFFIFCFTCFAIGFTIFVIISFIAITKKRNSYKKQYDTYKFQYENEIKKQIIALTKNIEDLELEIEKIETDYSIRYPKATEEINEHTQEIRSIASDTQATVIALNKAYGHILSQTDWNNLDPVIFYLQTGRADNIKEALVLVDKQRQNNAILQELSNVSKSIVNTLNSGFDNLSSTMDSQFSRLSSQINGSLTQSHNLQRQLSSQTRQLISATKLNSALLEKSNKTSETLLNDLRYQQKYWIK